MSAAKSDIACNIRTISKELQKKAKEELNEDPNRVKEDIQQLKDWLQKQPHLIARQDDNFLLSFLRGCKFSVQKTKDKLDRFHTIKGLWEEYYGVRCPMSKIHQRALSLGVILPLPRPNGVDGPRIVLVRWGVCDATTMLLTDLTKLMLMILEILLLEDDNAVVGGLQLIADITDLSPGYVLQCTPKALYRLATLIQSVYPLRIKNLDYINVPSIFNSILILFKSILSKKLSHRVNSYTTNQISDLYKYCPQKYFPKEYGGETEDLQTITERWKKKVESYSQWFEDDSKYCSIEKLRPEESNGESFGIEGTFRKLNID